MTAPNLATEAALAGDYPSERFNQRERKLLQSVEEYISTSIAPTFVVLAAGEFTTVGGDANEAITVTGCLASDLVVATLQTKGATPRTLLTAQTAANAVNLEFSGDPSTDHVVTYMVLRAAP